LVAKLLTAARAGVFSESFDDGSPELAVGIAALAGALAERHPRTRGSVDAVAGAYLAEEPPDWKALRALRTELRSIPAFAMAAVPGAVLA
jgi:hypothetical protein